LHLCGRIGENADQQFLDELARALRGMSNLTSLTFGFSPSTYPAILAAAKLISSLKELSVWDCMRHEAMSVAESTAFSQCLAECPLEAVTLLDISFPTETSSGPVCQGISRSLAQSITLMNVMLTDGKHAARALATSARLSRLKVSSWTHRASLSAFLAVLTEKMPILKLNVLDFEDLCQKLFDGVSEKDDDERLSITETYLPGLIAAAAKCSTLCELRLPYAWYSVALDEALGKLMQTCSPNLERLVLGCPLRPQDELAPVRYPRFLDGLRLNMTIKQVVLKYREPGWPLSRTYKDPWCTLMKQEISMMTRLNSAGRRYLTVEPMDHRQGRAVLEQVNDDLSCLFFHLRENPSITTRLD
jgi:hypothetical protein